MSPDHVIAMSHREGCECDACEVDHFEGDDCDTLSRSLAEDAALMALTRSVRKMSDLALDRLCGWMCWGAEAAWVAADYGIDDSTALESAVAGVLDATADELGRPTLHGYPDRGRMAITVRR